MSTVGGGFDMYGQMPDTYSFVVNSNHPVVGSINSAKSQSLDEKLRPLTKEINTLTQQKQTMADETKNKKDEEILQSTKDELTDIEKNIATVNKNKDELLSQFGKNNNFVKQLIDIALLANNKLKGEALATFVKRSIELLKNN
jgi:molecular chaperone HtpG